MNIAITVCDILSLCGEERKNMNTLRISRKEKKGVEGQKTLPMKILHLFYLFSITLSNIRIAPNAFGKQNHFDPPPLPPV